MVEQRVKRARDRLKMLEGIPELTLTFEPPDCDHTLLFIYIVGSSGMGWAKAGSALSNASRGI